MAPRLTAHNPTPPTDALWHECRVLSNLPF